VLNGAITFHETISFSIAGEVAMLEDKIKQFVYSLPGLDLCQVLL
jgi:hypothetical protein